jgi:hypothetical protein
VGNHQALPAVTLSVGWGKGLPCVCSHVFVYSDVHAGGLVCVYVRSMHFHTMCVWTWGVCTCMVCVSVHERVGDCMLALLPLLIQES